MTARVAKAELHCHFEGTISPSLMQKLATRNQLNIPDAMLDDDGNYLWTDFLQFLSCYDKASSVIRTCDDYRDIAYTYLLSAAKEGAIYVEMFTSPDHAADVGVSYQEMNAGIAQGIDDAERDAGIIGRMVATCVRHLGPKNALKVAQAVVDHPHPYVVGFGMGGDEAQHNAIDFGPAFDLAFESGLLCTSHAGEVLGAESVEDTLDALPVIRIGHGVRAIENALLLDRIIEEGITLEVCPASNFALGIYENAMDHPLKKLIEAGCKVTLGSDDPPFFKTSIGNEYEIAKKVFGLSDAHLRTLTANAIDAAFVSEDIKNVLKEKM